MNYLLLRSAAQRYLGAYGAGSALGTASKAPLHGIEGFANTSAMLVGVEKQYALGHAKEPLFKARSAAKFPMGYGCVKPRQVQKQ